MKAIGHWLNLGIRDLPPSLWRDDSQATSRSEGVRASCRSLGVANRYAWTFDVTARRPMTFGVGSMELIWRRSDSFEKIARLWASVKAQIAASVALSDPTFRT